MVISDGTVKLLSTVLLSPEEDGTPHALTDEAVLPLAHLLLRGLESSGTALSSALQLKLEKLVRDVVKTYPGGVKRQLPHFASVVGLMKTMLRRPTEQLLSGIR